MAEGIAQSSPDGTEEPLPGAVEMIVIRKLPVKFDPDSTYIRPDFYAELVKLADIMKSSDSISARIEGQPDSMGDVKQNIRLTERRVERVRDSQINLGVNPDRISTEVHEPSRPIADSAPNQVVISLALTEGAQAVPAPAAAGAIPAPARVEKAPLKPGPASTPAGEKKPLPAAVPGVVPVPPAPPARVETVPSVRGEAVPAPAAAGAIPVPARDEKAPLKPGPASTPAGDKKPLPAAVPGVVPVPPAPAAAGAIPAPARVETAPLKPGPAPTATAPSPVTAGERPKPAPALPVTAPTAQPAPVVVEVPARQVVGKKVVRKLTVEFDVDSSYVKPKYYNKLSKIADIMKSSANSSARIAGHTDSSGRFSYNVKLSKQRAQSVRSSLIKLGVAPDRISTVGYGPSRPIADNATVEGKRRNRRAVTFVTLEIFE
jgi:outer membrane protein OmpA-like peptidoglycan-associated protein